ncbi:MAG: hypothetical protein H0U74_12645, partial [Bradymonadaceae bacterium]|nr:hypothetical protein [Lujinxingiaceae bacterium]
MQDFSQSIFRVAERLLVLKGMQGLSDKQREELHSQIDLLHATLLNRRPAQIAIFGAPEAPLGRFVSAVMGEDINAALEVKEQLGRGRWYDYRTPRGALRLLDARTQDDQEISFKAIEREMPDQLVVLCTLEEFESAPFVRRIAEVAERIQAIEAKAPAVLVVLSNAANLRAPRVREAIARCSKTSQ